METSLAKSFWKVLAQVVEPIPRRRSGSICGGCAYGMSYQTPALGQRGLSGSLVELCCAFRCPWAELGAVGKALSSDCGKRFAILVHPGNAGMEVKRPWCLQEMSRALLCLGCLPTLVLSPPQGFALHTLFPGLGLSPPGNW